ncbi:hypothetical protein Trydic_g7721 [Trypoxylus dichotomus]
MWQFFEAIDSICAKYKMCNAKLSYKTISNLKGHITTKHSTLEFSLSVQKKVIEEVHRIGDVQTDQHLHYSFLHPNINLHQKNHSFFATKS